MRIIQLTPGAGDSFYCENCLRDHGSVRQLRRLGVEVSMVPLYLPAIDDTPAQAEPETPIFFGGINVYLQQKSGLFRHTPRFIDRLFDAKPLLRWAGRKAGMTRSRDLAETMLSMLRGEHGRQVKELDRLIDYLADQPKPDVVHLSNALLTGLAGRIREKLQCRVTCGLEDEEAFVDALEEPYRTKVWEMLSDRCGQLDGMISSSADYGRRMMQRLQLDEDRFTHVSDGVEIEQYVPAQASPAAATIGFLSQMTRGKGLAELVEAFLTLRREMPDLQLHVCGGKTAGDEPYIQAVRRRIDEAGAGDDVCFVDGFDLPSKREFLSKLTVLSVPTLRPEASALYALEALAAAVPLVLPEHGVNIEIAAAAGGIDLVTPNDPAALVDGLRRMLTDTARRDQLARAGAAGAADYFNIEAHGDRMLQAFTQYLTA
ncbi:MAG: glycosyltransferase family 4 protein [Phycisphaerae bacterium]